MRRLRFFVAIIFITVVALIIYPRFRAFSGEIPTVLKEAKKPFLFLLLCFQAVSYFGNSLLSKAILSIFGYKVRLKDTIRAALLSIVGSQLVPVFGIAAMAYSFYKKLKIPTGTIFSLIISWTLLVNLIYLLFFSLAVFFIPGSLFDLIPLRRLLVIILTFLLLVLFTNFLLKNRGKNLIALLTRIINIINQVGSRINGNGRMINPEISKVSVSDFCQTLKMLWENKRKVPRALIGAFLFYLGNIATLYFCFVIFGFHPDIFVLIFGFSLSLVLTVSTLMPDVPGVIESSLSTLFIWLGFPPHITVFAAILYRLFSYWLPMPLGLFLFFKLQKENNKENEN